MQMSADALPPGSGRSTYHTLKPTTSALIPTGSDGSVVSPHKPTYIQGAYHHHHGHHHGDAKPPTLRGMAHKREQLAERGDSATAGSDDSSYSSYSDSSFSDSDSEYGGDDEVKEAKGEEAGSVLSIQLFMDANASLRPTASCPFPRINWKGTRVYKRWLKGHLPVLNKVRGHLSIWV